MISSTISSCSIVGSESSKRNTTWTRLPDRISMDEEYSSNAYEDGLLLPPLLHYQVLPEGGIWPPNLGASTVSPSMDLRFCNLFLEFRMFALLGSGSNNGRNAWEILPMCEEQLAQIQQPHLRRSLMPPSATPSTPCRL